jgi:peptide-methionine (S)-S-oxide reductase
MRFRTNKIRNYNEDDLRMKKKTTESGIRFFHDKIAESRCSRNSDCTLLSLKPTKSKYEIAIVACGCFWNPQTRFQKMKGVKRVIAGYTGGTSTSPSRKTLHDHTRALFIEYNPKKVSYLQLLAMWLDNDYPWELEESSANRSALFITTLEQQKEAIQFLHDLLQVQPDGYLYVALERATSFYQAEEYQQNYLVKQVESAREQLRLFANNQAPSGLFAITE